MSHNKIHNRGMIEVPRHFNELCFHPFPYPKDNHEVFEEWYFHHYEEIPGMTERLYLPIFWTGYYIRANYGKDQLKLQHLQRYLNTLDTSKKYYTIVQYDDGIKPFNDLSHLDIKVFSMSGEPMDCALPLICTKHRYAYKGERDLFANFIGKITHPIRQHVIDTVKGNLKYTINTATLELEEYCKILSRSIFTLCPRGYGKTSFRIMEAIQYGSIPVYISDEFIEPHGMFFDAYGILIKENQINDMDEILTSIPTWVIKLKQDELPNVFKVLYSYEGNKALIQSYLINHII